MANLLDDLCRRYSYDSCEEFLLEDTPENRELVREAVMTLEPFGAGIFPDVNIVDTRGGPMISSVVARYLEHKIRKEL